MARFILRPFTPANFLRACKGQSTVVALAAKQQIQYLLGYLRDIRCKTILIEHDYVDRDYLEDHSAYYVKCFKAYHNHCVRLHFFSSVLTELQLTRYLEDRTFEWDDFGSDNYLGFIVIKPLPETIIGRTCLATYSGEPERSFHAAYECNAHFLGKTLSVRSVAFQEQDTVLAACATTAVWSALQKTGQLFRHSVPTPAEITALATQHGTNTGRIFPSLGLELGQMCRAIHAVGLETELRAGKKLTDLRGLIYSYGALGLPVILGVAPTRKPDEAHAVTVVGYRKPASGPPPNRAQVHLASNTLTQLYVHDDQVGPFVRAKIVGPATISTLNPKSLTTSRDLDIFALLIPVHRKIRVTYEKALKDATDFSDVLFIARYSLDNNIPELTWDLQLTTGVDLLLEYSRSLEITGQLRRRALSRSLPRFVWRARGLDGEHGLLDLLIDATDVERGFTAIAVLPRTESMANFLKDSWRRRKQIRAFHKAVAIANPGWADIAVWLQLMAG